LRLPDIMSCRLTGELPRVNAPIIFSTDLELHSFVDSYPDLATWASAKDVLDSDGADEIDDIFEDVMECKENRLWKMESTT